MNKKDKIIHDLAIALAVKIANENDHDIAQNAYINYIKFTKELENIDINLLCEDIC